MNIIELKNRARRINRDSRPSVFTAGLIYFLIIAVFSFLSSRLLTTSADQAALEKAYTMIQNGQYYQANDFLAGFMPSGKNTAVDFLIQLATAILRAGFIIFIINTVRNQAPCFGNLLDGFAICGRVILLYIMESIVIFLWSLLLLFPGLIAFYQYRLAIYLLIDNPDMSVFECMRKSREMMKGHKGELFSLDMSMLGWFLLAGILPPAQIYTEPYTKTVYTLYYQELAGIVDYFDAFN